MIRRILLILLALGAAFAAAQAMPTPQETWRFPLVVLLWVLTILAVAPLPADLRGFIAAPLHRLRAHPILNWFVILIYSVGAILLWLLPYQPAMGRQLAPIEFEYL